MKLGQIVSMVLAAVALSGCSSLEFLNTVSGTPAVAPVTLAYGEAQRQRVDIYPQPVAGIGAGAPVIVFFYGARGPVACAPTMPLWPARFMISDTWWRYRIID